MNMILTIAALLLSLNTLAHVVAGQQVTCSCEKASDRTCHGSVTCPNGCSALCGSKDTCYLSCRNDVLYPRVSIKLVEKTGQEIASVLSAQTHKHVEFVPYPRNARAKYDLDIKVDDIWNALNFLSQRGNVKIGGVDFEKLKALRREMRKGKKVSVTFTRIPVKAAVDDLSFMSGLPFQVKSGNAEKLLSISLRQATVTQIIDRISATAGVTVEKKKLTSIR